MSKKIRLVSLMLIGIMMFSIMPVETFAKTASKKKPSKVKITSVKAKGRRVTVKWKKAKHVKKYQVYRRINKGKWKKVKTLKRSKRVYKFRGEAGTKYSFKVRGINGKKKGKFSKVKSVKTKKVIYKNAKKVVDYSKNKSLTYTVKRSSEDINITVDSDTKLNTGKNNVIILPETEEHPNGYAIKVSSSEKDGDKYTISGTDPTIGEIYDDIAINVNEEISKENIKLASGVKYTDSSQGMTLSASNTPEVSYELSFKQDNYEGKIKISNLRGILKTSILYGNVKDFKIGLNYKLTTSLSMKTPDATAKMKLMDVDIPTKVPGLKCCIILYAKMSLDGKISLEAVSNVTNAVQLAKSDIKPIFSIVPEEININASVTFDPGVSLEIGARLFEIEEPFGSIELTASMPLNLKTIQRLFPEMLCLNIKISLKLSGEIGDCTIKKIYGIKEKLSIEWELDKYHFEYDRKSEKWNKVSKCTYGTEGSGPEPESTGIAAYDKILKEYYRVLNGYDINKKVMDIETCGLMSCPCGYCIFDGNHFAKECDEKLYYALYDMNSDGTKEMFISFRYSDDGIKNNFASIWTLSGDKAKCLIGSHTPRCFIFMRSATQICYNSFSGAFQWTRTYALSGDSLQQRKEIIKDDDVYYIDDNEVTEKQYNNAMRNYATEYDMTFNWKLIA